MKNTKNAVPMLQNLFGKTTVQLNKANIALRNSAMALGIEDVENVTKEEFMALVEKYVEKSKVKPEAVLENWTFENISDETNNKAKTANGRTGTVKDVKEYLEVIGETEKFITWLNNGKK